MRYSLTEEQIDRLEEAMKKDGFNLPRDHVAQVCLRLARLKYGLLRNVVEGHSGLAPKPDTQF
jgi:hypothetical protein